MNDLLHEPLWKPEQLGAPIPDSPHAVSVCLPTWQANIGYEEADPRVMSKLSTGYPRFVYNRLCRELFAECERRFARADETCLAFPTGPAAERFAGLLVRLGGRAPRVQPFEACGVYAAVVARADAALAKSIWQHAGEGVSSRQAAAALAGAVPAAGGDEAKRLIRERIAGLAGVTAADVFLFPCGMSAVYHLHRVLGVLFAERRSVQFGFPYVDSLKIQQKFGPGAHFFPRGDRDELERLATLLEREPISGLFTEFPSNPLLVSPDLDMLSSLARRHGFPLIVDETLAGFANVDVLPVADAICTSLTKFFSGVGDVTGGAIVLNPRSLFYREFAAELPRQVEDTVWGEDAVVLERNSRDYRPRMEAINRSAETVADFLREDSRVETVYFPKYQTPSQYAAFQRRQGGYGGLLSIQLRDAARTAPRFYDALRVCKGPNLGMAYTLACPYTILAHYGELDFAESCGVSRHLIRVSVGAEPAEELIERFAQALEC